ncbi:MAG: PspC domain-containing protein [Promicromonosporaceae bacterium]|nr:PspC domain-containing protein [Promicromonosporaceae bacterium]
MNTQPHPTHYRPTQRPFFRPTQGRVFGGVCAAVADHFGWNRTTVRIAAVASIMLPGPQVLIYLAAWALIPSEQRYFEQLRWQQPVPAWTPAPQHTYPSPANPIQL